MFTFCFIIALLIPSAEKKSDELILDICKVGSEIEMKMMQVCDVID
jgi:hypothetical protein